MALRARKVSGAFEKRPPGDLLEGIDDTIRSTCVQVTGVKLNSSSDEFLVIGVEIRLVSEILMLLSMANCAAV